MFMKAYVGEGKGYQEFGESGAKTAENQDGVRLV